MRRVILISLLLISCTTEILAQGPWARQNLGRKNQFYLYWGWNRSWYTNSDIRLYGTDHDFILEDVKATDLPTPFSMESYFYITRISIPQTNLKLGYYLDNKNSIAFGFDHMKYKVVENQWVNITGEINRPSGYTGTYDHEEVQLTREFLMYNHTDGLNYVFAEWNRHVHPISLARNKIVLSAEPGLSAALLRPRSAVRFLQTQGPNVYHNAGYGINGKIGINILLFKHLSIMSELKGGFINMPNIRATATKQGQAKQHFWFLQSNILIGTTLALW
jgi:hypothetical protein